MGLRAGEGTDSGAWEPAGLHRVQAGSHLLFFLPVAFFTHTVGSSFQALSEVSGRSHSFSAYLGWGKKKIQAGLMWKLTSGPVEKLFPTQLGPAFHILGEKRTVLVTLLCPFVPVLSPPSCCFGGP